VLFSYDSSVKATPDLNPQGDYLERVRSAWRPPMTDLLAK